MMIQFLADNIDQLDLALDQLAVRDRNFDRFALLLVDNVVELTLHRHAQDKAGENELWSKIDKPKYPPRDVEQAVGRNFEPKVKLAKKVGMISAEAAESILNLHSFRNTAYHQGERHEAIVHSAALFYFVTACDVLLSYEPRFWSWSSNDKLSHRSRKYIGKDVGLGNHEDRFQSAFARLRDVALSMKQDLIGDLHEDMAQVIDDVDEAINFLKRNRTDGASRDDVVIESQAWAFAVTQDGQRFIQQNRITSRSAPARVRWLAENQDWPVKKDPIVSWRRRLNNLKSETDYNLVLKRYCDFMRQTENVRTTILEGAAALDDYIQMQVDIARGK